MKKWQIIDLVRTLSISLVMALHLNGFLDPQFKSPANSYLYRAWELFQKNGIYGVFLFFVVSGFLISGVIAGNPGGLFKPRYRLFYVQRAGRILPLFVFVCYLGFLIHLFSEDISLDFQKIYLADYGNPWFWLSLATFTFNWHFVFIPTHSFYGLHWSVLWSLSLEEQFYLFFPLTLRNLRNRGNLLILLICVIALSLSWRTFSYLHFPDNEFMWRCTPFGVFDQIAIGVLLYLSHQRFSRFLSKNKGVSFFLCFSGFLVMVAVYSTTDWLNGFDRIYSTPAIGLGLFCFLLGGLHLPFFESKYFRLLSFPGKYCYGCYLIHPTILYFLMPVFRRLSPFLAFGVFMTVTTLIAAVSFRFFEKPANHLIRRNYGA